MAVSSQPSSVSFKQNVFVYLFVCPFLLLLFDKYISWQRNGMGVIPMTGCCLLLFVLGINFWRPGTTSLYPEVSILDLVIIRLLLSFTALYLVCNFIVRRHFWIKVFCLSYLFLGSEKSSTISRIHLVAPTPGIFTDRDCYRAICWFPPTKVICFPFSSQTMHLPHLTHTAHTYLRTFASI